ncbi:MAG: nitrile hydratase accessory protein [Bosea sp. (in: a-proteobacteria)]|jgi:nitrile hydratase accessory protein
MSAHAIIPGLDAALAGTSPLPCDAAGPVFAEPWQAQAFAMVVALHAHGLFTWAEWAEALSQEIAAAPLQADGTDDGSHYYACWLEALEHITIAKGVSSHVAIDALAASWARAAEATPHGRPVALENDPQHGAGSRA